VELIGRIADEITRIATQETRSAPWIGAIAD
jgi:hypothetical protein